MPDHSQEDVVKLHIGNKDYQLVNRFIIILTVCQEKYYEKIF